MASSSDQDQLKVTLESPRLSSSGQKLLRVSQPGLGPLDISFRRTVRVPDNGSTYRLPPDCGPFSLFSVKDYEKQLPDTMVIRGGSFIPMYEREAMWIKFVAYRPFAIKVYVGGINAVSGEPAIETEGKASRRQARSSKGHSIQDYVVSPSQLWLDGITTTDGKVMQFTATPVGSGVSVEAQLAGSDAIAGIQFEVMPMKPNPINIEVQTLTGEVIPLLVDLGTSVAHMKELISSREGIPTYRQRLLLDGKDLLDEETPWSESIRDRTKLVLRRAPAVPFKSPTHSIRDDLDFSTEMHPKAKEAMSEMAIAPGGLIHQTIVRDPIPTEKWDKENSIFFNVQILHPSTFEQLLGFPAPPTPITPEIYSKYGYPFFKLYEEKSGISGDFGGIKSVGQMRKEKGKDEEADLPFRTVDIKRSGHGSSFMTVSELEAAVRNASL